LGRVVSTTPRPLYPRERDWVPMVWEIGWNRRAGLDGCRKMSPSPLPHRDLIPGPSSPYTVQLYRPTLLLCDQPNALSVITFWTARFRLITVMKTSFLVSKKEPHLYYKTCRLMLCREVVAVQCESNTKRTNILCGQNVKFTCSEGNVYHGTGHGGPEGE
jgi:hypothetical protein